MTDIDRRQLLVSSAGVATLAWVSAASAAKTASSASITLGRAQDFTLGWKFQRGAGSGFEVPTFNDDSWRSLDLPHDWNIEDLSSKGDPSAIIGPFDKDAPGGTSSGFASGGEGWYRKRFKLAQPKPGRAEILFEGVYLDSDVWINGHHLGKHANGYTPFAYNLTPFLSANGENVIAVQVRSEGYNARWYSGAGIYRHVSLNVLPEAARIAPWGVGVVTRRLNAGKAELEISTKVETLSAGMTLVSRIRDAAGRAVWESAIPATGEVQQSAAIGAPRLWSPDSPNLYRLETELRRGGVVVDHVETSFGVRIVSFSPEQGMRVNGVATKLRGGCIHHDHGILGAAAFADAEDRKVTLLKARGFNAVRPSHNLFSPAFLRACDRQGMMVVCETFDTWQESKFSPLDSAIHFDADWKADLTAIVLSSRNHPSVIMWSIGNEIPARNTPRGIEIQWTIANEVSHLDPSRPVTAAINGFAGHEVMPAAESLRPGAPVAKDMTSSAFLDIVGYNYKLLDYKADHKRFPKRIFVGTESFPKDVFAIWDLTDKSPWLIGDFVWTAMDYLGEAGIGGSALVAASDPNARADFAGWPWVNAYCGDIDLIGQQKPASFARDVAWGVSKLEIAVQRPVPDGKVEMLRFWGWHDEFPSWTWPQAGQKPLTVRVYTVGDQVELWLNGRKIETRPVLPKDHKAIEFNLMFAPGTLEAVAFRDGREIARQRLETVGAPETIRLIAEPFGDGTGRGDLRFIRIEAVDADGRVIPDFEQDVEISLTGAGELIAFGSANPLATGSYQSTKTRTWRGRALAVVRCNGKAGAVRIEAGGKGLRSAMLALKLVDDPAPGGRP